MPANPIDPLSGPRYALEGRVVTMDSSDRVLDRGIVYIHAGSIAAVLRGDEPLPAGFDGVKAIQTGGTIFPGLIELHNHLSYNILPLWQVPKRYTNRDQWSGTPVYQKLISGPMKVLGMTPGYVEAIVRYVECKCLLGGVTTTQGIALFSNQGIFRFYRGIVRNVEQTDDDDLPEASTRIGDVEAADAEKFRARLKRSSCLILHLSEGVDSRAHQHFEALRLASGEWAINPALSGIHCVALTPDDFRIMKEGGASTVWSPLSNLLLYGQTADIKAAKEKEVLIGIGSDWSPSGSKNLLGELKVARLVSAALGGVFSDRELVGMVTRNAAAILKWSAVIGSVEAGKRADLLVVAGRAGDPYARLLEASEEDVALVIINGVPRCGRRGLMEKFGSPTEQLRVDRALRLLNLKQETADPVVGALTLDAARDRLSDGLARLPELARQLEHPIARAFRADISTEQPQWFLVLDQKEPEGVALRHHLPGPRGVATATVPERASLPLSDILEPVKLDPLTVADDPAFLNRLGEQPNLPDYVKTGLPDLY